jgi:hypothetical protein
MNFKQAAITVEKRLGLASSERLRVLSYCVQALIDLSRKLAVDRKMIFHVLTVKADISPSVDADGDGDGIVNLSDYTDAAPFIFLDLLQFGTIYDENNNKCSWITPTQARYALPFSTSGLQIWLVGKKLKVKGDYRERLYFEVPGCLDITKISKTLETKFIDKVCEMAAEIKGVNRPDYAQDGPK